MNMNSETGRNIDYSGYLHIDVSGSLHDNTIDSGIACVSTDSDFHVGTTLSRKFKKDLKKFVGNDYAQLYAIIIYNLLLNVDIPKYKGIVICNDAEPKRVRYILEVLFNGNAEYEKLDKYSITKLREIVGNPHLKSLADNHANSYRRRGLHPHRHHKGTLLHYVPTKHSSIRDLWQEKLKVSEAKLTQPNNAR